MTKSGLDSNLSASAFTAFSLTTQHRREGCRGMPDREICRSQDMEVKQGRCLGDMWQWPVPAPLPRPPQGSRASIVDWVSAAWHGDSLVVII